MVLKLILCAVIGYLLGSINTSLVVGKLFFKKDVREFGSGNAGATNTLRTLGKGAAAVVVLGDALKGVLACLVGFYLGGAYEPGVYLGMYLAGAGSVLGHNWPVFFGFKGGKGVMTTFAVVLVFHPLGALLSLAAFILIVAATRYVSLGSILASVLFPVWTLALGASLYVVLFGGGLALLIVLRHLPNIQRLIKKEEKKLSFKKN